MKMLHRRMSCFKKKKEGWVHKEVPRCHDHDAFPFTTRYCVSVLFN